MTPLVDLQVLKPGKAPAARRLAALEGSLSSVDSEVGHQLVLSIEGLRVPRTVLVSNSLVEVQGRGLANLPVAGVLLRPSPVLHVVSVDVSHQLGLVKEFL